MFLCRLYHLNPYLADIFLEKIVGGIEFSWGKKTNSVFFCLKNLANRGMLIIIESFSEISECHLKQKLSQYVNA